MKNIGKFLYKIMVFITIFIMLWAVTQKLSNNRFSIGGIKIFTVITGSMIPVYNIGDIIIVKNVPVEKIKIGDDIVYEGKKGAYSNKTITHRVIQIEQKEDGNYKIVTKGVANTAQDPEINQTQVIGKVIGKVQIISFILKIITNIYVIIFLPVVILIYKNIKRIIEYEKNKKRKGSNK